MATLSALVAETTTIKNTLTTCHTKLKTNLTNKGVSVSSTDKLSTLVDKVSTISQSNNKYSLCINVYTQTTRPTAKNVGDIWINTTKKLNVIFSNKQPSSPKENDLWLETLNLNCNLTIDSSINSTLGVSSSKTYTINLLTNAMGSTSGLYALFKNSSSAIYGNYGSANLYTNGSWQNTEVNYWTGSEWLLTLPAKLYIIQGGRFANTDLFGKFHSGVASYISQGTYVKFTVQDNSGFGKLSFTFDNTVSLDAYTSVTTTFLHNTNGVSGSINLLQSGTKLGYTASPPTSAQQAVAWSGTVSSSMRTVTNNIKLKSGGYYFGLYLYSYDPTYFYIKDMYLSRNVSNTYSETFDGTSVALTEEEKLQTQLMLEKGKRLKEIYFKSLGYNEEEIKIINENQLEVNEYFRLNGNNVIQSLEITDK